MVLLQELGLLDVILRESMQLNRHVVAGEAYNFTSA